MQVCSACQHVAVHAVTVEVHRLGNFLYANIPVASNSNSNSATRIDSPIFFKHTFSIEIPVGLTKSAYGSVG